MSIKYIKKGYGLGVVIRLKRFDDLKMNLIKHKNRKRVFNQPHHLHVRIRRRRPLPKMTTFNEIGMMSLYLFSNADFQQIFVIRLEFQDQPGSTEHTTKRSQFLWSWIRRSALLCLVLKPQCLGGVHSSLHGRC